MTSRLRATVLILATLVCIVAVALLPRVPQNPAYHNFADGRTLLGIPNCLNVASNLPFLFVGFAGCVFMAGRFRSRRGNSPVISICYFIFFLGVTLTCIGSSYYHLAPDNGRLVWDRLPMSFAFMAFLAAIIAERASEKAAAWLLVPLIACGIASLIYWNWSESAGRGDLRFYGFIQFYPVIAVGLLIGLYPARFTRTGDLMGVVGWYALAKAFEALDKPIFLALRISGHTLKHLAAGLSVYRVLRMLNRRKAIAPAREALLDPVPNSGN